MRPGPNGQFGDANSVSGHTIGADGEILAAVAATAVVLVVVKRRLRLRLRLRLCCGREGLDGAAELGVPRVQRRKRRAVAQPTVQLGANVRGVVARHFAAKARANAVGPIDQDHGQDGQIVARFNAHAVVGEVVQQGPVVGVKQLCRHGVEVGKDVTRRGRVVAALDARPKLAVGHEQINVVGPDKGLRHAHNGALQAHFAVVVAGLLADVAAQLRHFDFAREVALEARKQHLALARLEAV